MFKRASVLPVALFISALALVLGACGPTAEEVATPVVTPPHVLTAEAQLTEVAPAAGTEMPAAAPTASVTEMPVASPGVTTTSSPVADVQSNQVVSVVDPWVRASGVTPQGAGRGPGAGAGGGLLLGDNDSAAFMTLVNNSDSPVTLTGVSSDVAAQVELYQTQPVQQISQVSQITIPASGAVEISQGQGYHVVLRDLQQTLQEGDMVTLTLSFQELDQVALQAPVRVPVPGSGRQ